MAWSVFIGSHSPVYSLNSGGGYSEVWECGPPMSAETPVFHRSRAWCLETPGWCSVDRLPALASHRVHELPDALDLEDQGVAVMDRTDALGRPHRDQVAGAQRRMMGIAFAALTMIRLVRLCCCTTPFTDSEIARSPNRGSSSFGITH